MPTCTSPRIADLLGVYFFADLPDTQLLEKWTYIKVLRIIDVKICNELGLQINQKKIRLSNPQRNSSLQIVELFFEYLS